MPSLSPSVVAAAQLAEKDWGIPASVSLAQYGLESGWGAHMPPGSNNPFGIKALAGQQSVMVPTREFVGGKYVIVRAPFRVFPSIAAAFSEHARLLRQGKPYARPREKLPDAEAFARALTGIYATDPKYGDKLVSIMRAYGLTQYDASPKAPPKIAPPKPAVTTAATTGAAVVTTVAVAATQVTWTPTILFGAAALTLALVYVAFAAFVTWKIITMSQALDDLTAAVGGVETSVDAAVAEIATLKAGTDETALAALKDRLNTASGKLNAAVAPPTT